MSVGSDDLYYPKNDYQLVQTICLSAMYTVLTSYVFDNEIFMWSVIGLNFEATQNAELGIILEIEASKSWNYTITRLTTLILYESLEETKMF